MATKSGKIRKEPVSQVERREEATQAIIAAALDVLGEGGYDKLTFSSVSKVAGYSRSVVQYYFSSKVALIVAVIDRVTEETLSLFKTSIEEKGLSPFGVLFGKLIDADKEAPSRSRARAVLFTDGSIAAVPEFNSRLRTYNRRAQTALRGVIEKHDPSCSDPEGLAAVMFGSIRGILQIAASDPDYDMVLALHALRRLIEAADGKSH